MKKNPNTIDMYHLLEHEGGQLLYEGVEGCVVREREGTTVMSDILDGQMLCRILRECGVTEPEQLAVKSRGVQEQVSAAFGLHSSMPCTQWSYWHTEPPALPDCDIRPLESCHAETAASHYGLLGDSKQYIARRIAAGRMWGVFEDGTLAGFIGTHSEGSMGMLEIFPEYRRKGYGLLLESFLIAWHLERGMTPYAHVVDGNVPSLRLQQKLGMEVGSLPAIWVY